MSKIIVALDGMSTEEALKMSRMVATLREMVKVNDQLDLPHGPGIAGEIMRNCLVMYDAKYYDIPSTVHRRISQLVSHCSPEFITVHASGGVEMMRQAVAAAPNSKIIAVTILTSFDDDECERIYGADVETKVIQFATDALEDGVAGIVCSPQELAILSRFEKFDELIKIVPGIRPDWYKKSDDQNRIDIPRAAILAGADYLVIGRPITTADNPLDALRQIQLEVELAMNELDLIKNERKLVMKKIEEDDKKFVLDCFKERGGIWLYDYEAANRGKAGLHAELKSGLCSDGFLNSKVVLNDPSLRKEMARRMCRYWVSGKRKLGWPDAIAGIPSGATDLGVDLAECMGVKVIEMEKINGVITLIGDIAPGTKLLLIEDFCTRGTGFTEAVRDIKSKSPMVEIMPYELTLINRGGMSEIDVDGSKFAIQALVTRRITDYEQKDCPMCALNSNRITPKSSIENWAKICTSQK